jgi:hypothetical protein
MDSRVEALLAHLLKLLTDLELLGHVNLPGLMDTTCTVHCTINCKGSIAVHKPTLRSWHYGVIIEWSGGLLVARPVNVYDTNLSIPGL